MTLLEALVILCYVAGIVGLLYALFTRMQTGSAMVAGILCAVFTAFTLVQITREGVLMFWTNHTANLTGLQVWWDLLLATVIAFIFIAPRARAAGMHVPLWAVFVITTASIGLLAMVARLFWLERQSAAA